MKWFQQAQKGPKAGWAQKLVAAARERLTAEPEPRPLRALTDAILDQSETPAEVSRWIEALVAAADDLGARDGAEWNERSRAVADALRLCVLDRDLTTAQWTRAARGLAALRARAALLDVLAHHDPLSLPAVDASTAARTQRLAALELVFVAASLASPPWDFRDRVEEARQLTRAAAAIEAAGRPLTDDTHRVLRAEATLAVGDASAARALADQALEQSPAVTAIPLAGRLLAVQVLADCRLNEPSRARASLNAYERAALADEAVSASRARRLRLELARAELAVDHPDACRKLLEPIVTDSAIADVTLWRDAWLLDFDCRVRLDPDDPRLLPDLQAVVERFQGDAVSQEHAARYQELLRRHSGDGDTGRDS